MVIVAGHITGDPEQREATTTEHIDEFSASGGHPVVGKGRDDLGQPGDQASRPRKGPAGLWERLRVQPEFDVGIERLDRRLVVALDSSREADAWSPRSAVTRGCRIAASGRSVLVQEGASADGDRQLA